MQSRANSSRASSDVRAHGASRERRLAHAFELARLTDVERQRDDSASNAVDELRNGRKVLGAARAGEHDRGFTRLSLSVNRSNRFTSALARRASGAMTRIVSSPARVPDDLRQSRAVERDAERLRLAQAGPQQHELLDAIDAQQVFGERRAAASIRRAWPFGAAARPGGW